MNYLIVIFLFIIIILLIRILYSLKYFNRGIVLDEEPKKIPNKTVENREYSFLTEVKSFNKSLNEEDFDEKETQYLLSKEAEGWEYIKKEIIFSAINDNNINTKYFWRKEIK
jgi:type II secretory pathway component PulC